MRIWIGRENGWWGRGGGKEKGFLSWVATTARLAGPIRALFANLDEAGRRAIRARVVEAGGAYGQPDGRLSMPERMLVASATKP